MIIRPYKKEDYREISQILKDGGNFDTVWDNEKHWNTKIEKDNDSILVAEIENKLVGCVLIIRDNWTSFIFRLAVKKEYQSKGIGFALMNEAEQQLQKTGEDEVAIFVNATDEKLQAYYEKRGYQRGGTYRCLYKKLT